MATLQQAVVGFSWDTAVDLSKKRTAADSAPQQSRAYSESQHIGSCGMRIPEICWAGYPAAVSMH